MSEFDVIDREASYKIAANLSFFYPSDQFGIAIYNQKTAATQFLHFDQHGLESLFEQQLITYPYLEKQLEKTKTSANELFKLLLSHKIIEKIAK